MSAPLRLTVRDLRNLATGLEALTRVRNTHGVSPNRHNPSLSIETEGGDDLALDLSWLPETEGAMGEWAIDDRLGS